MLLYIEAQFSPLIKDPLLFDGTLRKNLDPFQEFKDDEIWSALKQVQLHEAFFTPHGNQTDFPLDLVKVSEGGANFSVGQRQLICLARAILKNNKMLVMDEATANVDPKTDELIQKTIREQFANCTILTVAHRLHTVLDSDKILVLNNGKVEEFDTPERLLENPESAFSLLINSLDQENNEEN